jgi:site-specific DNA-methyltransferase (adenine-specific)
VEKMVKKYYGKNGTVTSAFGSSRRENHDSSLFYSRKMYSSHRNTPPSEYVEKIIPDAILDEVHCIDSRDMSIIPDESVHLVVTSPPYNCGKEYDENLDLSEYRALLIAVFKEVYRKLVNGGRACINIANLGRSPYIPLHSYLIHDMLEIGYLMRGEIIWKKASRAGGSTAWGSWMSATNPTLRDVHEYILVFSKNNWRLPHNEKNSTINKEDFMEYTTSIWDFSPESAKKVGHPAPFPEELPKRAIQLYSFEGNVVLDPFCGSGTTCVAAMNSNRHYLGFDIDEQYVTLAKDRLNRLQKSKKVPILSLET